MRHAPATQSQAHLTAARLAGRTLFALAVAAPWLWLMAFAGLVLAAAAAVGHFPSYSNPDPKHVPEAEAFCAATYYLAAPALISPILLLISQALRKAMDLGLAPGRWIWINLAGVALIVALFVGNPLGLANWYLD